MQIFEFDELSPNTLNWGWDEIIDTTSVAGYNFYGLAQYSAPGVPPDETAAVWVIYCLNTNTGKTRYYPYSQVWSTRATNLPGGLPGS